MEKENNISKAKLLEKEIEAYLFSIDAPFISFYNEENKPTIELSKEFMNDFGNDYCYQSTEKIVAINASVDGMGIGFMMESELTKDRRKFLSMSKSFTYDAQTLELMDKLMYARYGGTDAIIAWNVIDSAKDPLKVLQEIKNTIEKLMKKSC